MINVPEFVTRGLSTMRNPSALDPMSVRYSTEADLRDALAAVWWLNGWDVRVEVKVPSCGRIDVLATSANSTVIVELKKKIRTTTQARQAFQQAHAYMAYLRSGAVDYDQQFTSFVTAGDYEWNAIAAALDAYREINFLHFANAADESVYAVANPFGITANAQTVARRRAASRAQALKTLADAARHADIYSTIAREDVPA